MEVPKFREFDDNDLQIKVIPSGWVGVDKLSLKWEVVSFSETYMEVQVFFDNPLLISSNGPEELE